MVEYVEVYLDRRNLGRLFEGKEYEGYNVRRGINSIKVLVPVDQIYSYYNILDEIKFKIRPSIREVKRLTLGGEESI